jgi:transposase
MEEWVKEWLAKQREMGKKCLEIKYIQGKPYVYYSTSTYNRETKKTKKISKYIGRLTPDRGLLTKGSTRPSQESTSTNSIISRPRSAYEYGNAKLLTEEFRELLPILTEAFPDHWEEIIALVLTRVSGYLPLKRVKPAWEKLDNLLNISPNCSPKNLSLTLRAIGDDILGQDMVFKHLCQGNRHLIYDLSFVFSLSDNLSLAEWGRNHEEIALPQVNIALFCGLETGLPVMLRPIPGSVKDVRTLLPSMDELQLKDAILILDRGFVSEEVLEGIFERNCSAIVPQRRNSVYFERRIHLKDHFMYHKRLIRGGKREITGKILYLFEDKDLELEEIKTLFKRVNKGDITQDEAKLQEKLAGRILFVSNVDKTPQEIYELYKTRDFVEKHFDTLKNEIQADVLYLGDRSAVCGHLFVGFLCLYLYCKLLIVIKKAGLTAEYSPKDVLLIFSKVMRISYEGFDQITEVPKKVRELEKKLKLDLFPK